MDRVAEATETVERMPIVGSRISAAVKLMRGNPRPWKRQRIFGNRLAWAVATVRAHRAERREQRHLHPDYAFQHSAGADAELEKAKELLDSGAITADEFETIRQRLRTQH